jgi:hypothetical protein
VKHRRRYSLFDPLHPHGISYAWSIQTLNFKSNGPSLCARIHKELHVWITCACASKFYAVWAPKYECPCNLSRKRAALQWEKNHVEYNFDVRKGPVSVQWFKGATTNLSVNCLDRNIEKGLGENVCFIWEGNEPSALQNFSEEHFWCNRKRYHP